LRGVTSRVARNRGLRLAIARLCLVE
jgi:hypothetical protein